MKQAFVITASSSKKIIAIKKIILEIIIALLVILWIYTGLLKLLDYDETRFQMGRSPFIQHIAGITAIAIPVLELMIVGLLIFKKTRFVGLLASLFLMVVFTGYIYAMLHYSYYIPCSCGGVLASLSWENHLVFNALYSSLTLIGIFLYDGVKR